ncbi:MAG: hypothetical protein HY811_12350 [Planctomycetes bacterium]|nr:hypothetical protein [Planctomycetota bacterium]
MKVISLWLLVVSAVAVMILGAVLLLNQPAKENLPPVSQTELTAQTEKPNTTVIVSYKWGE